jgi:hypothetical protein
MLLSIALSYPQALRACSVSNPKTLTPQQRESMLNGELAAQFLGANHLDRLRIGVDMHGGNHGAVTASGEIHAPPAWPVLRARWLLSVWVCVIRVGVAFQV